MSNRQSRDATEGYREQRPDSGVAVQRAARHNSSHDAEPRHKENAAPQGNHGRNDAAADGLVAAASAAPQKKLAPVIIRPGFINSVEAFIIFKTAAAAAAAATTKSSYQKASRVACS